jgi:hypothetical protein
MTDITTAQFVVVLLVAFLAGVAVGDIMALAKARGIFSEYKKAIRQYRELLGFTDD